MVICSESVGVLSARHYQQTIDTVRRGARLLSGGRRESVSLSENRFSFLTFAEMRREVFGEVLANRSRGLVERAAMDMMTAPPIAVIVIVERDCVKASSRCCGYGRC